MTTRPLRLKAQKIEAISGPIALDRPYVSCWVDTGVFHLDQAFDYTVPLSLSDVIEPGMRVQVPFGGQEREAFVLNRTEQSSTQSGLKSISKTLGENVVLPTALVALIQTLSTRYASTPYDLLRSAIPPRSPSVEREALSPKELNPPGETISHLAAESVRAYVSADAGIDSLETLREIALSRISKGAVLVLLPEERELDRFAQLLDASDISYLLASGSQSRTERYRSFLQINAGVSNLVIGTRNAIFSQIPNLQSLIVYRESSESFYEPRTPGWNVRDIALVRSNSENLSLIFLGHSPSSEVARLIESKWLTYFPSQSKVKARAFEAQAGQSLPERIFTPIRGALKKGPVLFLVPRKGYAQALVCSHCSNIPICDCGSPLQKRSLKAPAICSLCTKSYPDLHCAFCSRSAFSIRGRGAVRYAEEIGRAFPGFVVHTSTAESSVIQVQKNPSLVIATPGCVPIVAGGYSSIAILDGDAFFSQTDLRAQERAREAIFHAASHLSQGGEILISITASHPITASLNQWDSRIILQRELADRSELMLPPFVRSISIELESRQSVEIARGISQAIESSRLPSTLRIIGPIPMKDSRSKIILYSPHKDALVVIEFIHELQRRRSMSRKELMRLRIDPYDLSL